MIYGVRLRIRKKKELETPTPDKTNFRGTHLYKVYDGEYPKQIPVPNSVVYNQVRPFSKLYTHPKTRWEISSFLVPLVLDLKLKEMRSTVPPVVARKKSLHVFILEDCEGFGRHILGR